MTSLSLLLLAAVQAGTLPEAAALQGFVAPTAIPPGRGTYAVSQEQTSIGQAVIGLSDHLTVTARVLGPLPGGGSGVLAAQGLGLRAGLPIGSWVHLGAGGTATGVVTGYWWPYAAFAWVHATVGGPRASLTVTGGAARWHDVNWAESEPAFPILVVGVARVTQGLAIVSESWALPTPGQADASWDVYWLSANGARFGVGDGCCALDLAAVIVGDEGGLGVHYPLPWVAFSWYFRRPGQGAVP
jgi:hypothetical protein